MTLTHYDLRRGKETVKRYVAVGSGKFRDDLDQTDKEFCDIVESAHRAGMRLCPRYQA